MDIKEIYIGYNNGLIRVEDKITNFYRYFTPKEFLEKLNINASKEE